MKTSSKDSVSDFLENSDVMDLYAVFELARKGSSTVGGVLRGIRAVLLLYAEEQEKKKLDNSSSL